MSTASRITDKCPTPLPHTEARLIGTFKRIQERLRDFGSALGIDGSHSDVIKL